MITRSCARWRRKTARRFGRRRLHRASPSPRSAASLPAALRRDFGTGTGIRSSLRIPRSAISDFGACREWDRAAACISGVASQRCFWQCPRRFRTLAVQPGRLRPHRRGEGAPARFQRNGVEFMTALWGIIACGVLAILYGIWAIQSVMSADAGSQKMQEISAAIREGAQAYLKRQYTTIAAVGIIIFVIVGFLLGWLVALGFAIGAVLSAAAGFIGMNVSVRANVRTAQAAIGSLAGGLDIAFKSGAITGMFVAGLALLGVTVYFTVLTGWLGRAPNDRTVVDALVALGFGGSLISIFARLGGGSFTNGANVGDNVGDCAGMAADLFETYAVTTVATMVLASIFFGGNSAILRPMMILPLAIGGACVVTSIIGTFFVKLGPSQSIMGALYKGFIVTAVLSLVGEALVIYFLLPGGFGPIPGAAYGGANLFACGVVGLVVTGLIVWITEYYTGTNFRPVQSIAKASITGHGTNIIQGLAISLESTALPTIVIIAGILVSYGLAGLFGIAVAVTSMLSLAGVVVALDAFGPVTDNAGGIAEMAGLPKEVRKSTDTLDAVGNTTKAITKGYAIGSAGLGALVLFAAYNE